MSDAPWDVKLFQRHPEDDPEEHCPGEEFLDQCANSVVADLMAIVDHWPI